MSAMLDGVLEVGTAPLPRGRRLPALYVPVAASRRLAWAFAGMHGLAAAVSVFVTVPLPAKIVLMAAIVASGIRAVRHHALLLDATACAGVRLREAGRCDIVRRDGTSIEGRICGESYVFRGLVILRVRREGVRRITTVVLVPDAVTPDAMRRLRVRLRWADGAANRKAADHLSL